MNKKVTTEEKYHKVVSDLNEGKFKTVDLACKANKISPASYHIYRKREEDRNAELGITPTPAQVPVAAKVISGGASEELYKQTIKKLQEENQKLRDMLVTLLK